MSTEKCRKQQCVRRFLFSAIESELFETDGWLKSLASDDVVGSKFDRSLNGECGPAFVYILI